MPVSARPFSWNKIIMILIGATALTGLTLSVLGYAFGLPAGLPTVAVRVVVGVLEAALLSRQIAPTDRS